MELGLAPEDKHAFDGAPLLHAQVVHTLRTRGAHADTCASCMGTPDGLGLCEPFGKKRSTLGSGAVGPWQTMDQAQRTVAEPAKKAKRLHESV